MADVFRFFFLADDSEVRDGSRHKFKGRTSSVRCDMFKPRGILPVPIEAASANDVGTSADGLALGLLEESRALLDEFNEACKNALAIALNLVHTTSQVIRPRLTPGMDHLASLTAIASTCRRDSNRCRSIGEAEEASDVLGYACSMVFRILGSSLSLLDLLAAASSWIIPHCYS